MISKLLVRFSAVLLAVSFVSVCLFAQPKTSTPNDDECARFGELIAGYLAASDGAAVTRLLDVEGFIDRMIVGMDMNRTEAADFKKGLLGSFRGTLSKEFSSFTGAKFLRLEKVKGQTRVLVRCAFSSGAVNFTAFIPVKSADGTIHWSDAHSYLSGETMTESLRRTILPLIVESKKGLLARLTSKEDEYVKNFPAVMKAIKTFQEGRPQEAIAIFDTLPKSVQRDRTVLIYRLRAAQPTSNEAYLAVLSDWREAFPNDATLDFISIDYAYLKKDYAAAARHIRAFNDALGGDNQLELMLANTYFIMDRLADARKTALKVYTDEPELNGAFDLLAAIALKTPDYPEIVRLLSELGRRYPQADLTRLVRNDESYTVFLESKEGREWIASLEKQVPAKQ